MKELAVYEAKTRLSELLAEVEKGEQFVITRRGEAIARLVSAAPAAAKRSQALAQRQRVAKRLRRAEAAAHRHDAGHAAATGHRTGA